MVYCMLQKKSVHVIGTKRLRHIWSLKWNIPYVLPTLQCFWCAVRCGSGEELVSRRPSQYYTVLCRAAEAVHRAVQASHHGWGLNGSHCCTGFQQDGHTGPCFLSPGMECSVMLKHISPSFLFTGMVMAWQCLIMVKVWYGNVWY
jgi:hypothetical protein